jgi:hypothetical protein
MRGTGDLNRQLLERLNASGAGFFSQTSVGGRFLLRWAIGNIHTTWEDVEQAFATMSSIADDLLKERRSS